MQGVKFSLVNFPSEKMRKCRDAIIGIVIMVAFVSASALVNRTIFAATNSGYGYGYSAGSYGYGYQYSDYLPSAPTGLVCSGTANGQITCVWSPVTTTIGSTTLSFGSYKLYRSTSSPATYSGTLVATVSTQSTGLAINDTGLSSGTTYYYALYAIDSVSETNYSAAATTYATPGSGGSTGGAVISGGGGTTPTTTTTTTSTDVTTPATTTTPTTTTTPSTTTTPTTTTTSSTQLANISTEASTVSTLGSEGLADLVGATRSLSTESASVELLGKAKLSVTNSTIAFVSYGTTTTLHLGSGERAGVLASYIGAYKAFPQTADEWSDLLKIGNGRWPGATSSDAETFALAQFKKVYLRDANRSNAKDDAAVMILGYGLRPASGARNLNSERVAITTYKNIFGSSASNARDWDTVRAIAYSGATR